MFLSGQVNLSICRMLLLVAFGTWLGEGRKLPIWSEGWVHLLDQFVQVRGHSSLHGVHHHVHLLFHHFHVLCHVHCATLQFKRAVRILLPLLLTGDVALFLVFPLPLVSHWELTIVLLFVVLFVLLIAETLLVPLIQLLLQLLVVLGEPLNHCD